MYWCTTNAFTNTFSYFSLYSLHNHLSSYFIHKYISTCSLSLPPCHPLSRMFNRRLRVAGKVVSFGLGMSPVLFCPLLSERTRHCLHTGVMDSVAADTAHISLSCPVLQGWTSNSPGNAIHGTKEWLIAWLWGTVFYLWRSLIYYWA